ncbi:MAG: hypothetical protein GXO88_00705 [Chlorobi bacterium]|nr:hypothetical protein [Chlorobiota bacterium]
MRKLILISMFAVIALGVDAQHVFEKGSIMFNAGTGLPHSNGFVPTINFSGEVGAIPTGTVGLVSFGGLTEFQFADNGIDIYPKFYIGGRAAWHLHAFQSDEFDAYGGVGFGISIAGKGYGSIPEPDVFVGGRWMFSPGMGLFAELGYTGLSSAKFGISFGL